MKLTSEGKVARRCVTGGGPKRTVRELKRRGKARAGIEKRGEILGHKEATVRARPDDGLEVEWSCRGTN